MGLVFTNENCVGCNRCISACSCEGANVAVEKNGANTIQVDGDRCISCAACFDVCPHDAREFNDDTEEFFAALGRGENVSILIAPAFKANYAQNYAQILGQLKGAGVNRILDVSFGADICTWGYIKYITENNFYGGISQPCPAVVGYFEKYLPELLPRLMPVHSPMMCAAVYLKKYAGVTDKLAFISPCIAKKVEIEDPHNEGLVQYNVTFEHLMRYVEEHAVEGPPADSEIEYGLGAFYPTPGGLAETVRWFLGDGVFIRQIEGEKRLYEWLHANSGRIRDGETPFLFIDALNCENGCICGTATEPEKAKTDDALYELLRIREAAKKRESGDAWSAPDPPEERLRRYNEQFAGLKLEDYLRGYTDRSAECAYEIPNEAELDEIFQSMNKLTEDSRRIDCTCCGYKTCRQMATAIHNGFNRKENCIHYERDMVHRLEVRSSTDLLTGLLNKISFEGAAKKLLSERVPDEVCALFILDFDNFKQVNDTYGHRVGDEVLKVFGAILRKCFRDNDVIGRVGGDEFMILMSGCIPEKTVVARCESINNILNHLKVESASGFSCSIGVVVDDAGSHFEELYQLADDALYEAKARGKAQFIEWRSHPVETPEQKTVLIATHDADRRRQVRQRLGEGYFYLEAEEATKALNEISLYRRCLKDVYIDFSMPDITEQALKDYIRSRPIFGEIEVHDVGELT